MGACMSMPEDTSASDASDRHGGARSDGRFPHNSSAHVAESKVLMHNRAAVLCHADSGGSSSAVTSIPAGCGPAGAESAQEADMPLDTLRQVHRLQNALAAVSDAPGLGLTEAAELLHAELDASLVSIYGFHGFSGAQVGGEACTGAPAAAVLLAAYGSGDDLLERCPVVTDPTWSPLRLRASGADSLAACADGGRRRLPGDWAALSRHAGLRSFLAVPIGPVARPWGVLAIAKDVPGSLAGPRWHVWPSVAAGALVHQVRHWQTAAACALLSKTAATDDRITLIGQLLRGAGSYLERACNARVGVRFAILDREATKALVFEAAAADASGQDGGAAAYHEGSAMVATEIDLPGTLLASAVSLRKARFVRDCTSYMQSSARPARDIFTQTAQLVASLLVVPFVYCEDAPLAALYLTLEAPNDFAHIQGPLLGFIKLIAPLLHQRLQDSLEAVWEEARAVRTHSSFGLPSLGLLSRTSTEGSSAASTMVDQPHLWRSSSGEAASSSMWSCGSGSRSGVDAPTSHLARCNTKRLCTSAMTKAVEQEIMNCKRLGSGDMSTAAALERSSSDRHAQLAAAACSELVLGDVIGAGGYGSVWRGSWKQVTAAIKVMYERATEQEAMMVAIEMAVLSTVSHPHIIQAFACLTDLVEAASPAPTRSLNGQRHSGGLSDSASSAPPPPCYRRLLPFEDPEDTETCSIIVMEYCNLGTLRQAAKRGVFRHRMSAGAAGVVRVDMAALLEVALQVAEAVSYLHSIRICHCDIKMDNVLLKSEVSQPRGYISKLADFGLVKVLGSGDAVVNVACAGTVTHLAPELFVKGSRVTTAVDAYAFGILMYELYMGGAGAYPGLSKAEIIERVGHGGMRPRFPPSAPRGYVRVATACWADDPAARPAFGRIICELQALRDLA